MAGFGSLYKGGFNASPRITTRATGGRVGGFSGGGAKPPKVGGVVQTGKPRGVTPGPHAPGVLTPGQPNVPSVAPAATTAPAALQPSPYDATYYNQLNGATLAANQKIAGYNSDIANNKTDLANALVQLNYQQGLSNTNAQNAENARGGFAQGALGNTLGQIAHQAQLTTSTDTLNAQRQQAAWSTAIAGVQSGLSVEQVALGLASAARAAKNPSTPITPTTGAAAAAGPPGVPGAAPGTIGALTSGAHGLGQVAVPKGTFNASPTVRTPGGKTKAPKVNSGTIRSGKNAKKVGQLKKGGF